MTNSISQAIFLKPKAVLCQIFCAATILNHGAWVKNAVLKKKEGLILTAMTPITYLYQNDFGCFSKQAQNPPADKKNFWLALSHLEMQLKIFQWSEKNTRRWLSAYVEKYPGLLITQKNDCHYVIEKIPFLKDRYQVVSIAKSILKKYQETFKKIILIEHESVAIAHYFQKKNPKECIVWLGETKMHWVCILCQMGYVLYTICFLKEALHIQQALQRFLWLIEQKKIYPSFNKIYLSFTQKIDVNFEIQPVPSIENLVLEGLTLKKKNANTLFI